MAPQSKRAQDKHEEALPLVERALATTTCALGETHEDTIHSQKMVKVVEDKVRGQESWSEVVWYTTSMQTPRVRSQAGKERSHMGDFVLFRIVLFRAAGGTYVMDTASKTMSAIPVGNLAPGSSALT